jgi:hypothetical protein
MELMRQVDNGLGEMRAVFRLLALGRLMLMSWALLRQLANTGLSSLIRSCRLTSCVLGHPGSPHSLGLLPMCCMRYVPQVWARLPLRFHTLRKELGPSEHLVRTMLQAGRGRILGSNDPGSLLGKILATRTRAPLPPLPPMFAA